MERREKLRSPLTWVPFRHGPTRQDPLAMSTLRPPAPSHLAASTSQPQPCRLFSISHSLCFSYPPSTQGGFPYSVLNSPDLRL